MSQLSILIWHMTKSQTMELTAVLVATFFAKIILLNCLKISGEVVERVIHVLLKIKSFAGNSVMSELTMRWRCA